MKIIPIIIFSLCFLHGLNAQWESLNGPYGGRISDLAKNDFYQYAATGDGLFRSANGKTWDIIQIIPGIRTASGYIDVYDSLVVVTVIELLPGATNRHLFLSKTNGDTWIEISRPPVTSTFDILGLYFTDFGIYAEEFDKLWFSGDEGQTWQISSFPIDTSSIFYVSTDHHQMYIGSTGGIYTSSDAADEWIFIAIPNSEAQVHHVFVDGSLILAVAPYHELLLRSSDGGQNWTWNEDERWYRNIYKDIVRLDDTYFLSLDSNIIKSTDQGMTWTKCDSKFYATAKEMITLDSSLLFATFYQGFIRSDDRGQSFYPATQGITASGVECVAIKDETLIAASSSSGIFDYDLLGSNWGIQYDDTLFTSYFHDMLALGSSLYVTDGSKHIYRFSDSDQSWTDISDVNSTGWYYNMNAFEDNLLVEHNGLQIWNPDDQSWTEFFIPYAGDTIRPYIFAQHEDYLFAAEEDQLFRKNVTNGLWEKILQTDTIEGLLYYQLVGVYPIADLLFIIMDLYNDSHKYRILKSDDQGTTWHYADEGFPEIVYPWWSGFDQMQQIGSFAVVNAHNYSFGIVVSALDDIHWFAFNEGLPSLAINDIAFDEEYMYAATSFNGVWRRKISDLYTTSTHSITTNQEFTIYPNPSNGNFNLKIDSRLPGKAKLVITDLNGKVCLTRNIELSNNYEVQADDLPSGLFFLSVQSGESIYSGKIVIQK